jgi:hypothetical protein
MTLLLYFAVWFAILWFLAWLGFVNAYQISRPVLASGVVAFLVALLIIAWHLWGMVFDDFAFPAAIAVAVVLFLGVGRLLKV